VGTDGENILVETCGQNCSEMMAPIVTDVVQCTLYLKTWEESMQEALRMMGVWGYTRRDVDSGCFKVAF
jgi:hypothetical protein